MARRVLLALLTVAAAPAAWWLRSQQLSAAYDPVSGLPLPLDQWGWGLWGLLAGLAVLTALLSLPERKTESLAQLRGVFPGAVLQGAGALLLAAGGGWQLYGLYPALRSLSALGAVTALLAAVGLFGGLRACLGGRTRAGGLLLMPMCAAAVQLILCYRAHAADPVLRHYEMELLSLASAALAAAALAGLAFGAGGRRRALLFCGVTPALSAAALCSAEGYGAALGLMGCAVAALGFFLSLLFGVPLAKAPAYELVEDPFRTGSVTVRKDAPVAPAPETAPAEKPDPPVEKPQSPPAEAAKAPKPAPTAPADIPKPAPAKAAEKSAQSPPARPAAKPVEAAPTASAPAKAAENDGFDLARVDRLLRELGVNEDSLS